MSKTFKLTLSTPEAVLYDGEAESITLETQDGEIGIMADHTPLVALIKPGIMNISQAGETKLLATGDGFVKVTKSSVKVFTQTAEFAESIDEERAIEAKKQAQAAMAEKVDNVSTADATALLERNIARLKTLERRKRRSHR